MHGPVAAGDIAALRDVAERLRLVFEAPDEASAAAAVNALLADTAASPWVSQHDGYAPHLHFARPDAAAAQRTAASAAMGLAVVLCDYGIGRLGTCAAGTCRDVFIDTSRNAQRRYCSDGCANRSNVAAHRARAREASAG
jgi:predicted RNA-binding Zn ribbon-like protein